MNKTVKATAQNCEVCGREVLSYQIRPAKVGSVIKDLCSSCIATTTAYKEFIESAKILSDMYKLGQLNDPMVDSPNIVIEPIDSNIQAAVELLKRMDSNYFKGVSKIVAGTEANYGHVSSDDPHIVHINLSRIGNEAKKDDSKRGIIIALAVTIAHEVSHVKSYDDEKGFVGGESVSSAEENKVLNWIKINENRLQDLFK